MNRFLIAIVLVSGLFSAATLGAEPDRIAVRSRAWQKVLEQREFDFHDEEASAFYSLFGYGGTCQVHMTYDPANPMALSFEFVRKGKDVLTIQGHLMSVFESAGDVLYFAHYRYASGGCVVTAYDLVTGRQLWETRLTGVRETGHSKYFNRVTIHIESGVGADKADKGDEFAISITGHEGSGDYIEVLDSATGTVLAHRVYRQAEG
jgi:hypothetical protein